jgi:hypothetical protein
MTSFGMTKMNGTATNTEYMLDTTLESSAATQQSLKTPVAPNAAPPPEVGPDDGLPLPPPPPPPPLPPDSQ